jgi:hypothetical protein
MMNDPENLANGGMLDLSICYLGHGPFLYLFGEAFG